MKAGVGRSPSPTHNGMIPGRPLPRLATAEMPLSGARRASVLRWSMTFMDVSYVIIREKQTPAELAGARDRGVALRARGQQVADFGQQLYIRRRGRIRLRRGGPFQ